MTPRCDIVITKDGAIYLNGTRVENIVNIQLEHDHHVGPGARLTLELVPTSVIFGDVPNETVDALTADQRTDTPAVDIARAIARVQARRAAGGAAPKSGPDRPPRDSTARLPDLYAEGHADVAG